MFLQAAAPPDSASAAAARGGAARAQGSVPSATVPSVVNHALPALSLLTVLICKSRLIRARGPWWNFAVIVPNFSNIFYYLHYSFMGGGGVLHGDDGMVRGDQCQLCKWHLRVFLQITLFARHCLCGNLIIKYYYAHVSVNFPRLGFNLIFPPAALLLDLCQNQSGSATKGPNKLPSI